MFKGMLLKFILTEGVGRCGLDYTRTAFQKGL